MKIRTLNLALAGICLGSVLLWACQPLQISSPVIRQSGVRAKVLQRSQTRVWGPQDFPAEIATRTQAQAQVYADEVSKRRGIDLFYLHPAPVGLQFEKGNAKAWLMSFPGTSRVQNDLNLELRALVSGSQTELNLNYSGPVTLGRLASLAQTLEKKTQALQSSDTFRFELISGLPGNGVTEAYGDFLEAQTRFLKSRFQARPFEFDDGPLIYAVHYAGQLQGFVFLNQRNRLILGERKYADLQSVVYVSTEREILASYTLVGFNPKTPDPLTPPAYTREDQDTLGSFFIYGEY